MHCGRHATALLQTDSGRARSTRIAPGKPAQNAFAESFNGRLRYVGPPRSAPSLNRSDPGKHRRQKWPPTQTSDGPKKQGRSTPLRVRKVR
jgi:hypothetical protein